MPATCTTVVPRSNPCRAGDWSICVSRLFNKFSTFFLIEIAETIAGRWFAGFCMCRRHLRMVCGFFKGSDPPPKPIFAPAFKGSLRVQKAYRTKVQHLSTPITPHVRRSYGGNTSQVTSLVRRICGTPTPALRLALRLTMRRKYGTAPAAQPRRAPGGQLRRIFRTRNSSAAHGRHAYSRPQGRPGSACDQCLKASA